MNIVDYVIIGIVAVSVIFGLYRGFLASLLNTGGGLIAFLGSFWLYPRIADWVRGNETIKNTLINYTDALTRVGDQTVANTQVNGLSGTTIADILSRVRLPAPLDSILKINLENEVFSPSGMTSVSDYVSQTVLGVAINVLSFIAAFIVLYLALAIVVNLLRIIFKLPVLKQLDTLAGGAFGLISAALICYILMILVPLVETIVPQAQVNALMQASINLAVVAGIKRRVGGVDPPPSEVGESFDVGGVRQREIPDVSVYVGALYLPAVAVLYAD